MIEKAYISDLKEILDLQHLAYITEARRFDNMNIQPLKETLDELIKEYNKGIILKFVYDNKIIGSIRGYEENNTLYIGKLMVHPDYRNKGFGSMLLLEIEKYYPNNRYELFTSSRSVENIRLYQKMGYSIFKESVVDGINFIYLEKNNTLD